MKVPLQVTYPAKILVVENETIIGANISLRLTALGYEVSGIVSHREEVVAQIKQKKPDVILLGTQIKGDIDGIEAALLMQKDFDIPIIYLAADGDDSNLNMIKAANPRSFISKPFKKSDLKNAIDLVIKRRQPAAQGEEITAAAENSPFILNDCIFVRHNERMLRVNITDILFIEADRNYCRMYSKTREYVQVMTLKEMDEKLPSQHFLRVHRSFIVNISQIEEIAAGHVVIAKREIPLSAEFRKALLQRIRKL